MQSTEPEIWKPVVGYEDRYEVSNLGKIWSVDRRDQWDRRHGGVMLTPILRADGHLVVSLYREGSSKIRWVHRLVLEAFVGPRPDGMEGLHWNDIPADNRVANLRWGTRSENVLDQVRNGRHANASNDRCRYGHLKLGANLFETKKARRCRACHRAYGYAYHRGTPFDPSVADRKYRQLMSVCTDPLEAA